MVITHKKITKLEKAYFDIINRLNNAGIKYETENKIIPHWDPNARDDKGNPIPKPADDSIGTGTAWIKIFNKDRKQVFVYFCCHLVECKTCTYDRFITVYDYHDDVNDTNLLGMETVTGLTPYTQTPIDDRTIYFKTTTTSNLLFAKPRTKTEDTPCPTCHGRGLITTVKEVSVGNQYKPKVKVAVDSLCTDCNGTGKVIPVTEYSKVNEIKIYEFFVKPGEKNGDPAYNRVHDGTIPGLDDEEPRNQGEGGLIKYTNRLYNDKNSYNYSEVYGLAKVTTFNTEIYHDSQGRCFTTLDELYDFIAKTNLENSGKSEWEKTDLSKYLFVIPVFEKYMKTVAPESDDDEPTEVEDYRLVDLRFYQTNYVDRFGKLIPITVFANFTTERPYDSDDDEYLDNYSTNGVTAWINGSKSAFNDYYYYLSDSYECAANFTKHCGEIEKTVSTYKYTSGKYVIHTPDIESFTDIADTDRIWNFICHRDRNLPIIPFDENSLYIAQAYNPFKADLTSEQFNIFKNILAQKTASFNDPLDAAIMLDTDSMPYQNYIYPINYFRGTAKTAKALLPDVGQMLRFPAPLEFIKTSNNSTMEFGIGGGPQSYPNTAPGLIFNDFTYNAVVSFDVHAKFNKIDTSVKPDADSVSVLAIKLGAILKELHEYREIDIIGTFYVSVSDIEEVRDPSDPTKVSYKWPAEINKQIKDLFISQNYMTIPGWSFPFKNLRLVVDVSFVTGNTTAYDYSDVDITVDMTVTTNLDEANAVDQATHMLNPGCNDITLLPKVKYNYNNFPEGVFHYYIKEFETYIKNYIFYKYTDKFMTLESDGKMKLIPETIESQDEYHGFMNILYNQKLRSIYTKMDSTKDDFLCPGCNGDENIQCSLCNGKRRLQMYGYNFDTINIDRRPGGNTYSNYLVRYKCPSMESESIDHIDHYSGGSIHKRCRICAGTGSVIRYYYLKAFDFCNLSEYDGRNPVEVDDLSNLEALDIINKAKDKMVLEKGSKTYEPYLNFIIRKHYGEAIGTTLDFGTYYPLYNAAVNNLVFYILNGKFIQYLYWNGFEHIKVNYGYNYIYSTKTYTKEEWERNKSGCTNNTVLYRVITGEKDVDEMVGFYVIRVENINQSNNALDPDYTLSTDPPGTSPHVVRVQRIYFDKAWVYSNLLNDMNFKHFNMFTEKVYNIIGAHQNLDEYVHQHEDDGTDNYEHRCQTCGGTGEVDGETCTTCNGTGANPDYEVKELKFAKHIYGYTSMPYINTDNISFEVNDQETPIVGSKGYEEIEFEE